MKKFGEDVTWQNMGLVGLNHEKHVSTEVPRLFQRIYFSIVLGCCYFFGFFAGRQEFGPRALGHRSLLAVPDSHEMRERMNRLKVRQWYRPVAPMIAQVWMKSNFRFWSCLWLFGRNRMEKSWKKQKGISTLDIDSQLCNPWFEVVKHLKLDTFFFLGYSI